MQSVLAAPFRGPQGNERARGNGRASDACGAALRRPGARSPYARIRATRHRICCLTPAAPDGGDAKLEIAPCLSAQSPFVLNGRRPWRGEIGLRCARYALRRLPRLGPILHVRLLPGSSPGDGAGERAARTQPALRPACGADARTSPRASPQRRAEARCGRTSGRACLSRPIFCAFALSRSGRMRIFVIWSGGKAFEGTPGTRTFLAQRTLALPSIDAQQALQMLVFAAECRSASKRTSPPCPPRQRPSRRPRVLDKRRRRRSAPSPGGGGREPAASHGALAHLNGRKSVLARAWKDTLRC